MARQYTRVPMLHEPRDGSAGAALAHLTTVVRRKTGRSVHRWISERRMTGARKLLRETDLTVEAVAARTGYRQPSFFVKHLRRDHTVTPTAWHQTRATTQPAGPAHMPRSGRPGAVPEVDGAAGEPVRAKQFQFRMGPAGERALAASADDGNQEQP